MTMPCLDLVPFVDGELLDEQAAAFRAHLLTCAACRAGLVEAAQMSVRLASLSAAPPHVKLVPGPPVESATGPRPAALVGQRSETADAAAGPAIAAQAPLSVPSPLRGPRSESSRRRAAVFLAAAVVPAAAAIALIVGVSSSKSSNAFADRATRPYEIRFAYPDATGYRPVH
ncbi:MAG TPA: zf-HC2 domain-containing protein, partial [Kofleriaceae bacterium]